MEALQVIILLTLMAKEAWLRLVCIVTKGGVGVTVISHDSESRTHVANIPECSSKGTGNM